MTERPALGGLPVCCSPPSPRSGWSRLRGTWGLRLGRRSPRPQAHVLSAMHPNLAVPRPDPRCLQDEPVTHIRVRVAGLRRGAVSKCAPAFSLSLSPAASHTPKPTPPRKESPPPARCRPWGGLPPRPPQAAHRSGRDGGWGDGTGRPLAREQGTLCLGDRVRGPSRYHSRVA